MDDELVRRSSGTTGRLAEPLLEAPSQARTGERLARPRPSARRAAAAFGRREARELGATTALLGPVRLPWDERWTHVGDLLDVADRLEPGRIARGSAHPSAWSWEARGRKDEGKGPRREKEREAHLISISRRVAMFLTCTGAGPAWARVLARGRRVRGEAKDMATGVEGCVGGRTKRRGRRALARCSPSLARLTLIRLTLTRLALVHQAGFPRVFRRGAARAC